MRSAPYRILRELVERRGNLVGVDGLGEVVGSLLA